jgi:hypothetical protein
MKKFLLLICSFGCALSLGQSAWAADFAFSPGEGFAAGCQGPGLVGDFEFQRNGRVGVLKYPATGAAFVLFQDKQDDLTKWSVTNEDDRMQVDFRAGTLAYRYDGRQGHYDCRGTFTRKP